MIIHDLEVETRLEKLEMNNENLSIILNSIAEKTSNYRNFAESINVSKSILLDSCKAYERTLLIDCYTFAEQLLKNLYYALVEKDSYNNKYLKKFINYKIPIDGFSPNVNYKFMGTALGKELVEGFRFILTANVDEIKSYNVMVKARHTYAHGGTYAFDNDKYEEVIKALKYIVFEFTMLMDKKLEKRIIFQNEYKSIVKRCSDITIFYSKLGVNLNRIDSKRMRDYLKCIKDESKVFDRKYYIKMNNIELLMDLSETVKSLTKMDLRKISESMVTVNTFNQLLK